MLCYAFNCILMNKSGSVDKYFVWLEIIACAKFLKIKYFGTIGSLANIL